VKSDEEIMQILEAFDLCRTFRSAAALAGCDHHTVAHYVELRAAGITPEPPPRDRLIDPYLDKIAEWVERSKGRIRADVAHDKLKALGYEGSERSTRRAVAEVKQAYEQGHHRIYQPWIPEPGMWLQWDFGAGPRIAGRDTLLWCAWLAWSRFRVVFPIWDRTLPTVIASLDRTLRAFGGAPTYALTDNEKTVTTAHVAGIALRHPEMVAASRWYGLTVATCVPADPESKGGSEATVRVAKADLVPTEANLLPDYPDFASLEQACRSFCEEVNARPHRETARPPAELLVVEREKLHPIPAEPYTAALGVTRRVTWSSTISFGGVRYSVPYKLAGGTVWVRVEGDELVATSVDPKRGTIEVARHRLSTPGNPRICPEHYPPRPAGALERAPRATNEAEAAFLALGDGARQWLVEAASAGAARVPGKMAKALALSKLHGAQAVDRALGTAAVASRFADGDLEAILAHQRQGDAAGEVVRPTDRHSLQPGTASWNGFGR
jgi:transposase